MIDFSGITNSIDTNQTDAIVLVHLYRDGSNYVRYATEQVVIGGENYRGLVQSIGSWSEKWNVETDNSVTQSIPSISLLNEKWQDGSGSIIETLSDSTYIGNRAVILVGFRGHALASYVTIYDGQIEDFGLSGNIINVSLKKNDLPKTHVGGRKINGSLIGDDDYTASFIPIEQADGKYLPVPFGNHWNAPLICYRKTDAGITSWCYVDNDYDSANMNLSTSTGIRPIALQQDNLRQSGSGKQRYVVFIENEGKLVPRYAYSMNGNTIFAANTDTGAGNLRTFQFDSPEDVSATVQYNDKIICNVPLRLYRLNVIGHAADWNNISLTAGGAAASGTDSDIDKMLDDDVNTVLGPYYSATNGTWSEIIFNAIVDLPKQLRSDGSFRVYSALPIHIPQPNDTSGGDQYTVLVFGKFVFDGGDQAGGVDNFRSHNYLFAFTVGNDKLTYDMPDPTSPSSSWLSAWDGGGSWENFIGATFIGRGARGTPSPNYPPPGYSWESTGQDHGYDYFTHTRLNDAGSDIGAGYNLFDATSDQIANNAVSDAGNIDDDSPDYNYDLITDEMGTLPMLRRDALDGGVGFRVELRFNDINASTDEVIANYEGLYLEAIETVDFFLDAPIYTRLKGYHDTNYVDMQSLKDGEFATQTYQYINLMITRKLGVAAGYMGSEWDDIYDAYDDFFGDDRYGSGFVTPVDEELPFDEFIKTYCDKEPFTVYRDQLGKYRIIMLPIDRSSLASRWASKIDTVYFKDCDGGFDIKLTDKKYLCSRVKECRTNYQYFDRGFVEKHEWSIANGGAYSFSFWDSENNYDSNKHVLESIEKKYTSQTEPSIVVNAADSTKGYSCLVTNEGTLIPLVRSAEGNVKYWEPLAGTSGDWGSPATYTATGQAGHWIGWDSENRAIASFWINQWCNRHRVVTCSSSRPEWLKYEVGDFVRFSGVPYTCLGLDVYGFNGSTATSATVNGQTVYDYFVITAVNKSVTRVQISCMQLHKLNQFITNRKNRRNPKLYRGENNAIDSLIKDSRRIAKKTGVLL